MPKLVRQILFYCFLGVLSCKKDGADLRKQTSKDLVESTNFFDFSIDEDDIDFAKIKNNANKYDLTLIGSFLAPYLSHRRILLKNFNSQERAKYTLKELRATFDPNRMYALDYGNGKISILKLTNVQLDEDKILITNNIKWHTNHPRQEQKKVNVKIWSFILPTEDKGIATICTIGDSQFHFRDAQDFRRNLDANFNGALKFLGKSQDNYQYAFHAYKHYTLYDLKQSLEQVPQSDYFIVNIGTNEWEKEPILMGDTLWKLLIKLHNRFPDSKILVSTVMPTSSLQKDAQKRSQFTKVYNSIIRERVAQFNNDKIVLIDIEKAFVEPMAPQLFKPDAVHLSYKFYRTYLQLINQELVKDPKLKSKYTGSLEVFDRFPLSQQLSFNSNGNTTQAGSYKLESVLGRTALRSQLDATNELKPPHRAEFNLELEPFYKNDEIWFGLKFLVPDTWEVDPDNLNRRVMIFQIHSKPEEGQTWKYYQENLPFNRPSMAFYLTKSNKGYAIELYYGLNGKPEFEFNDKKWSKVATRSVAPNSWIDFIVTYRLSHDDSGFIRAWINDESFTPLNGIDNRVYGPNMHNSALPYLKFGQYRYWQDSHEHRLFFDDLKVFPTADEYFYPSNVPEKFK